MTWNFLNSEKRKEKDFDRAVNNAFSNLTESYIGTDKINSESTVIALARLNQRVYQYLKDQKLEHEEKAKIISEAIEYLEVKSNLNNK